MKMMIYLDLLIKICYIINNKRKVLLEGVNSPSDKKGVNMEKMKLDKETIEKLKEFEKTVLGIKNQRYAVDGELDLDDFYGILDEMIYEYEYLKQEKEKIEDMLCNPDNYRDE